MKTTSLAFLGIFILITGYGMQLSHAQMNIESSLKEANDKFTYEGKPIHPGLIQQFMPWLSDSDEPTTISVDVAAGHSNQYFDKDVEIQNKGICLKKENDAGIFCYEWLGKLANGLHVLEVGDNGGGSATFDDLVFVRFDIGDGINQDGNPYKRLLMTVIRDYSIGGNYVGDVKVYPDKVVIPASKNRVSEQIIKHDIVLTFPK